jgi:hypothetical protein
MIIKPLHNVYNFKHASNYQQTLQPSNMQITVIRWVCKGLGSLIYIVIKISGLENWD